MKRKLVLLLVMTLLITSVFGTVQVGAATYDVTVDADTTHQTLEGFGAAIAWYNSWLTGHPNQEELYKLLFFDSGIDILRLRNQYRYDPDFAYADSQIVKFAKMMNPDLKLFLASWSPPKELKKDELMNGGTLIKEDGSFVYDKFADYWYESLQAYEDLGIVPDYISIQNEPDYTNPDWETCQFNATEDQNYPGYGEAFDAVYNRLQDLPNIPKFLAPEVTGVGSDVVQNYVANIDLDKVHAIAHHLYNGGDGSYPDGYNDIFETLNNEYPDKPLFQTEYDYGTPLNTAHLIHNSLVIEEVSAYFFWDLIWDDSQRPLVELDPPFDESSWRNEKGYNIRDFYYSVQHFAKYTDPGYKRIETDTDSSDVKASAFISPDEENLTVVLVNTGNSQHSVNLDMNGYSSSQSEVFQTAFGGDDRFASQGSLSGNTVSLPAQSVVTVAFGDIDQGEAPDIPDSELPEEEEAPDSRSAFGLIEAELYNDMSGIQSELIGGSGNRNVAYIESNDWVSYTNVNFDDEATGFEVRVASGTDGGDIEIRLGSPQGTKVATIPISGTGDWEVWEDVSADIDSITGTHDLYLLFTGGSGYLFNIDNFRFTGTPADDNIDTTGKVGDLNADDYVDSTDIVLMRRYLTNSDTDLPVDDVEYAADLNEDGYIDSIDYAVFRKFLTNEINELPY
ncbi:MAG: carbohydrate-binding protein [Halanaerobiaceae bacterium]